MKTTTSNPLIIGFGIAFACAAFARNEGFSRFSGDRSTSGSTSVSDSRSTAPASAPARAFSAPASNPSRQVPVSRPEVSVRSAPVTPSTRATAPVIQQAAPAPRAQETPSFRTAAPRVSVQAPQTPVYSAPRVSLPEAPRVSPAPQTRTFSDTSRAQVTRPAETVRPQAFERTATPPVAARERTAPAPETVSPRFSQPAENTRTFGTSRVGGSSPAVAPQPSTRTFQPPGDTGFSRNDGAVRTDAIRRTAPHVTDTAARAPAHELSGNSRSSMRDITDSHDSALTRSSASRIGSRDLRPEQTSGQTAIAPMRFGTSGIRDAASRGGGSTALPSALSLRSSRSDADTDRFGRAAVPRTVPASRLRGDPVHASIPASQSPSRPFVRDSAVYRPPYGRTGQHHQPAYTPHRNFVTTYSHHSDRHHPRGWHEPCAFSPIWWGPVVYPAGFGLTWYSGSFGLSIATYAPVCSYTRYYDSWYGGGWGYSGVYYGGWRHGWYGGFSYVYNPWPAYLTYYLYDPYPVTETVYITQPATTTVTVAQPATTTVVTDPSASYSAAPASYAAVPADVAGTVSAWDAAPAAQQAEAAATTCFCPCHCNGIKPCTCAYPCGSEYALRDEDLDLSLAFSSYANTMNAEIIWSSYAGLDRWDARADAYDGDAFATAGGNVQ